MPWREDPTPYHVWVSEIMLQQTRVEAVKPYYDRFLQRFPDVETLSRATEEQLLKAWEGLGYYNRVRNLGKAARILMERYDGNMPGTAEELKSLPGIGSYTAGAVASIAFGEPVPAVDGNVLRVYTRLLADERPITEDKVKKSIEEEFYKIMPKRRSGDLNQALMELGALVCAPGGEPKCEVCPLQDLCRTGKKGDGSYGSYPVKKAQKPRNIEKKTVLLLCNDRKLMIRQRPAKGLLAGMYEFPVMEGHQDRKQVIEYVRRLGFEPLQVKKLPSAKHVFTHKEWHMVGYEVRLDELASLTPRAGEENLLFADRKGIEEVYPIPSAYSAYTSYLQIPQGALKMKKKRKETLS